jgi:signal transduction histidine kinase/CheY-like chemotaxis protein
MDKILQYSATLSVLYIRPKIYFSTQVYKILEPFFTRITVSKGIGAYTRDYAVEHVYDIIIIDVEEDWERSLKIISDIQKIHPSQMILPIHSIYSNQQLLTLIKSKVIYFLHKPLVFEESYTILFDASKALYDEKILLSEKISLEKKVREIENKDLFFANISHEMRSPINAVIGLSHILLERKLDEKSKDYAQKIQSSGKMILHIINDILDFSKIEAGKIKLEAIDFDINTVLENTSTVISLKAHEKKLDFIFDIHKSVPSILKGDPFRLAQVLINLLSNAVKFTSKGSISVSAKVIPHTKENDLLEFRVSDTGIGLSPSQISTLFLPFTQASTHTSKQYGGTGLGLSISKQLVELMGGKMRVESTVGKGSVFIFTIATTLYKADFSCLSPKKLQNKKVLIIDKNPKSKEALEHILDYFSYEILETPSLEKLKSIILEHTLDILFIDKETLESYSKKEFFPKKCKAKIVLMHNSMDEIENATLKDMPIDAYLEKPFHNQNIVSVIYKVFGEKMHHKAENTFTKKSLYTLEGANILLVEDNKINQSVILALLEYTGIEIHIANNGKEAIALVQSIPSLDLIFMDIEMPMMNGWEVTLELKKIEKIQNIPIVTLSGNTKQSDRDKSAKLGMVAHLDKPIDVNKFYATLLEFIMSKEYFTKELKNAQDEFDALLSMWGDK